MNRRSVVNRGTATVLVMSFLTGSVSVWTPTHAADLPAGDAAILAGSGEVTVPVSSGEPLGTGPASTGEGPPEALPAKPPVYAEATVLPLFSGKPPAAPAVEFPVGPTSPVVPRESVGFDPLTSVEIPARRDVLERSWLNADGTSTSQFSSEALNFKNASGEWVAVDNSLVVAADGSVRNAANEWTVSFGSIADGVEVDTVAGSLGWKARAGRNVEPVVEPDGVSVRYTDVWPGVDVVYRVSGSRVSEFFELKSAASATEFALDVRGAGLVPDGSGGWSTTGDLAEIDVSIPAPMSVDAKGAPVDGRVDVVVSPPVASAVDTVPVLDGVVADVNQTMTFSVDAGWLQGLPVDRFPVVVDPPVYLPPGCTCPGFTNPVRSYTNLGGELQDGIARVGNPVEAASPTKRWRSVVTFNIASIFGANVSEAHLRYGPQPVGTGVWELQGYHAAAWGWHEPQGAAVILDSVDADSPYYQDLGQSDALSALYNNWAINSIDGGALLLTGREDNNLYTLVAGTVDLFVDYDRFPTPPSNFSGTTTGGYHAALSFSPGSDPEGPMSYTAWVGTVNNPDLAIDSWPYYAGWVDFSGYLNQPIYYGVEWDDGYPGTPWTGASPHDGSWASSFVPTDRPPTQMVPQSPVNGLTSTTFAHPLSATMGTDLDGDVLEYRFFYCPDSACGTKNYFSGWTPGQSGATISQAVTFPTPAAPFSSQTLYWGAEIRDPFLTTVPTGTNIRSIQINNPAPTATNLPPTDQLLALTGPRPVLSALVSDVTPGQSPQTVNYRWVLKPEGGSGILASSPWASVTSGSTVSWQFPAGLVSELGYRWTLELDDPLKAVASYSGTIKTQGRLGADSVSPMQPAGPVQVNLATGNVFLAGAGGKSIATVGGQVGVAYSYNSQDRSGAGLKATYYVDANANNAPDAAEVKLVRVDGLASFDWGTGTPAESVPPGPYKVRWEGYMRMPEAGNWKFAGGSATNDSLTIKVDAAQTTVFTGSGQAIDDPNIFTSSVVKNYAVGAIVKVTIDYSHVAGSALSGFRAQLDGSQGVVEYAVTQDWFTLDQPNLPIGWNLVVDNGVGARWSKATVNETTIVLTAVDGSTVTYNKEVGANSAVSWKPPVDEDDIVVLNTDLSVTIHASGGGEDYNFDRAGVLVSVTTVADDLKLAGAVTTRDPATGKVTELRDRLDATNTRKISLHYQGLGTCPEALGGIYDATAPQGMLCRITYPDLTETRLYYSGGMLARISDPGDEAAAGAAPEGRQITEMVWSLGRLVSVTPVSSSDRIAAQTAGTVTSGVIATADLDAELVWNPDANLRRPDTVILPRPLAGASRPQTSFTWGLCPPPPPALPGADCTTSVEVQPLGTVRTVIFDTTGRTKEDKDAVNRKTTTVWSNSTDVALSSETGGRLSTTIYDADNHPTDSYGPAPTTCFNTTSRVPNGSCTGLNAVPHTRTEYDHNLKGLQGAHWTTPGWTGTPISHAMTPNASGAIDYSWTGATAPPNVPNGENWSARFTGVYNPTVVGLYQFRLIVGATDTATIYINETAFGAATGGVAGNQTIFSGTLAATTAIRFRIDFKAGTGDSLLRLGITPPGGSESFLYGSQIKPGFYYATKTTVDDAGTGVPASMITETRFDEGIDPVYGVATSTTENPGGLALKTVNGFEAPAVNSLLRRTRRTLPAFATAPSTANSTTYAYYPTTGTGSSVDNPCTVAIESIPQGAMTKTSQSATPATGSAIITETVYDILGRPVASKYAAESAWTCTTYDARGRVTTVVYPPDTTYPSGRTVATTYRASAIPANLGDPFVTKVTDPAGTIISIVDALGRLVSYTDVWNQTTTTTYDQAGRTTQASGPAGLFEYVYDIAGRLTQQKIDTLEIAVPHYTADSAALDPGRMDYVTYPSGAGKGGNGTRGDILVDSLGRVRKITWSNIATSTLITSDEVTRSLTGKVLTDSIDGVVTPAWTYTYDGVGRLTNAVGSGHNYLYGYAATGGCGANTGAGSNSNRTTLVDNAVTVASYCYDNADRLTSTTQPGYTTPIVYDSHGNTTQIAGQTMTFDAANRHIGTYLPNIASPTTSVVYQRDATDRIVARTASVTAAGGPAAVVFRGASAANSGATGATSVTVTKPAAVVAGDLMLMGLVINSTTPVITPPSEWVLVTSVPNGTAERTYVYRKLAGGSEPASYQFGFSFNVKSAVGISAYSGVDVSTPVEVFLPLTNASVTAQVAPSVTTLSANTRVVRVWGVKKETSLTPPAGVTERVDTSSTGTGSVTVSIGDAAQATAGASGTATATSASVGVGGHLTLVLKAAPAGGPTTTVTTHRYSYSAGGDSGDVVLDTGNVVIERTFGLPGGVMVQDRGPTGDVWSYPNIHGDTQAVANVSGVKQGVTLTYDPFGNPLAGIVDNQAGEYDNGWLGQHQRPLEHQTGLAAVIEMGARIYDPTLGRFLQVDPIEGGTTTNDYGYVRDPINQYDLTGEGLRSWFKKKARNFWNGDWGQCARQTQCAILTGAVFYWSSAITAMGCVGVVTCGIFGAGAAIAVNAVKNATLGKKPFDGTCSAAVIGSNPFAKILKQIAKQILTAISKVCK